MFTVKPRVLLSSLFITGVLGGCVPAKLTEDINRLNENVSDLRKFQAEQTTRIASIESQLRQASGKVEELEYSQNKKLGSDLTNLKEDLSALRRRVPPPAIVPASTLEADEISAAQLPADIGKQMSDGLSKIREGNFSSAKSIFEELQAFSEGADYAAIMAFWVGVSNEGIGNNREAIGTYLGLVSKYPKNPRSALALLRQASVLIRLKDFKSAKIALNKLVTDFPKTEEATRAKEKLKDIK